MRSEALERLTHCRAAYDAAKDAYRDVLVNLTAANVRDKADRAAMRQTLAENRTARRLERQRAAERRSLANQERRAAERRAKQVGPCLCCTVEGRPADVCLKLLRP